MIEEDKEDTGEIHGERAWLCEDERGTCYGSEKEHDCARTSGEPVMAQAVETCASLVQNSINKASLHQPTSCTDTANKGLNEMANKEQTI